MDQPTTGRAERRRRRGPRRAAIVAATLVIAATAATGAVLAFRDSGGTSAAARVGRSADRPATTAPAATTTTAPATTTTAPRDPRRGSGQPVRLAFGGDTHFEAGLRTKVLADPSGAFLSPIAPVLAGADLAMVNLETAVADHGTPLVKQYVFHAPPVAFGALRGAGVDVVTMANNHGTDYGAVGLQESLAAAQNAQFPVVGIGANADAAYAPWRIEIKGQRIAVFGFAQVTEGLTATPTSGGVASAHDVARTLAAVQAARADSDTIVVYVHWGNEGDTCPTPAQKTLAQQLVDAGADVVVGSHAHRQQGAGRLGTSFVDFGLGNFIWYNESGDSGTTGVLVVTVTGRDTDAWQWVSARIRGGVPTPLEGPTAALAAGAWGALQGCSGLAP